MKANVMNLTLEKLLPRYYLLPFEIWSFVRMLNSGLLLI